MNMHLYVYDFSNYFGVSDILSPSISRVDSLTIENGSYMGGGGWQSFDWYICKVDHIKKTHPASVLQKKKDDKLMYIDF